MTALPLKGMRVLDFTGVQAGPACTQLMAWFGARCDVFRLNRPVLKSYSRPRAV